MFTHTFGVTDVARVILDPLNADRVSGYIKNTGSNDVYLGGPNVDTSNAGYLLAAGEEIPIPTYVGGEKLYARCVAGSPTMVRVFSTLPADTSIDFTPLDVPGLEAWYDASDLATITSVAGRVSQWNDKSGNARHVVQASAGEKPLTGGSTLNGLNVLTFSNARGDALQYAPVALSQPLTVFAVAKNTALSDNQQILGNSASPEATLFMIHNHWSLFAGAVAESATDVDTNAHQVTGLFNGASSVLYLDGVSILTGDPDVAGRTTIEIGAGNAGEANCWNGDIPEVIIGSGISTANRLLLQAYQKTKWATP